MSVIAISLRAGLPGPIDVEGLAPDRLATASERDIASLRVWAGRREGRLGDFFEVRGSASARVWLQGDLSLVHGIGAGMLSGELIVDGAAGDDVGAGMSGGTIEVRGRAGHGAGAAMGGGLLQIGGDAGDRLGAALPGAARGMTGGEIIVRGSAGIDTGSHLRRGLIVVVGDAGRDAGRAMIAGTLIVGGRIDGSPGRGNKRGSIVALGPVMVPPTYQYACTFRPPHLRLTCTYLRRRHGVTLREGAVDGPYRRYCGDAGDPGKGEILELIPRDALS